MAEEETKPDAIELESFKKVILDLVPAATKVARSALRPRKNWKNKETGEWVKPAPIASQSVALAKYVLEQYAKLIMPGDTDVHELHIVDHAMLAKMKDARKIMKEIADYNTASRGVDVGRN